MIIVYSNDKKTGSLALSQKTKLLLYLWCRLAKHENNNNITNKNIEIKIEIVWDNVNILHLVSMQATCLYVENTLRK